MVHFLNSYMTLHALYGSFACVFTRTVEGRAFHFIVVNKEANCGSLAPMGMASFAAGVRRER
jgi:hypothetical protein